MCGGFGRTKTRLLFGRRGLIRRTTRGRLVILLAIGESSKKLKVKRRRALLLLLVFYRIHRRGILGVIELAVLNHSMEPLHSETVDNDHDD